MKKLITHGNTILLFCLTTFFAVTACSTTGMQRSEDVQSTMQTVDNDIKEIIVQLDAINSSLDERREELGQTYDKIAQNNVGVKQAFQTYVSDINEIERFLSNDLTSEGIDSITRISDNVVNKGSHLKNELQNLQAVIEEARIKMRQS